MSTKEPDLERVKELIKIMQENDLVEIEIANGDGKIVLKRAKPHEPASGAIAAVPILTPHAVIHPIRSAPGAIEGPASSTSPKQDSTLTEIRSPLVGTFYETPSPDSEPYVQIGSHVDPQMVVCIIEAMKVMNEIKAEVSGTIVDKLVKNGEAVEYGQPLFRVRPE